MQLGLELALMGMVTVFSFLILLIFLTSLMSKTICAYEKKTLQCETAAFVTCDLVTDSADRAIIETIIGMADNLGLSVIAEGIENEEQVKFLQERGCHIAQGFLYSKPLPAENCEKLLIDSLGKS